MRFRVAMSFLLVCVASSRSHAQIRAETIRGVVKTDSGKVIAAADIIVTMAPNREIFRATSDSTGRYRLTIDKGTGDYLVYIGAAGRRAFRKRVVRSGNDSTYVIDATLAKEVTTVAAVRTTAQRTPPVRGDRAPAQVGAMSTQFAGVTGSLPPDQMGDLAAMASVIPGVAMTPDGGISVLGIDPSQNHVTLNGMSFDGASLPRDLTAAVRIATTIFDPTVGNFGGLLIASEISSGQPLTLGKGHLTIDAPQLQAADATARTLGQRYSQGSVSVGRSGELAQDLWVYNAAIQGSRRSSPISSLSTANPAALQRLGVSADSANRLLDILSSAGAPFRAGGIGSSVTSTNVNGGFRLDRTQTLAFGGLPQDTRVRVSISGIGNYSESSPLGSTALTSSSRDLRSSTGGLWLQGTVSQYFGKTAGYLSETKSAVSYRDQRMTPYVVAPSASVLVTSDLDDGSQAINALRFGGSSSATRSSTWRWEGSNELSFSLANAPAHHMKVFTQAQLDGYRDSESSELGTFVFNSLADLQSNTPASYSRTLFTPARNGGEASGAFAVADYWTKSPNLSFVFGPRVEWNAFTRAPLENPEVERLFGARTSTAPNTLHISPRLGFNWLYHGRQPGPIAVASYLGTVYPPTRGVLKGGIGEFRAPYNPALLSSAITGTGLAGSTAIRLTCLGSAVPTPVWSDYTNAAGAPSTCANGSGASSFADAAPSVQLFDPSYTAARRWTGNLTWSSAWRSFLYSVDGAYSLNLNQPGIVDLNYDGKQQFALSNEDNRPIFVAPTSIVPSSGLVSPLDARASQLFGRVISRRSDLRSDAKQATISVIPTSLEKFSRFFLSGSYTYSASRSLSSGFDANTFGDPRAREWSIGPIPEHQVRVQAGYNLRTLRSSVTTYWILQSGYAYTPVVAGDINGDGIANDRAFVFNPSSASPAIAAGMRNLLSSTSASARDCLERQLGAVAQRNGCRRPWSATMNARWSFDHRFGDSYHYVNGAINFANPLAGLDQLLHGGNKLRGWGIPASPDPTLYFVRGFDQSAKQFVYEVNPQFGRARPALSALYNPFRVTVDFSFSLNGNVQRQRAEQLLRPTRNTPGVRPPVDTILRRVLSGGPTPISPFYWVLQNADSLLLSPEQVNAVNAAAEQRQKYIDSTYRALAVDLARLPADADIDAAVKRVSQTETAIFSGAPTMSGRLLSAILTPIQLRLLPPTFIRSFDIKIGKPGTP
jgi:hypothetical protein